MSRGSAATSRHSAASISAGSRDDSRSRLSPGTSASRRRQSWPSVGRAGQIGAPGGEIDPGQNQLGIARLDQRRGAAHDLAGRHRPARAAPQRDDAERAGMIAALLHLDEAAGAALEAVDRQRRALLEPRKIADIDARRVAIACGVELLAVAEDAVDLGHRGKGLGVDLRGAAGDDHRRSGRATAGAADRLARLALGLGRHRAGVDDHRIDERRRRRRRDGSPRIRRH